MTATNSRAEMANDLAYDPFTSAALEIGPEEPMRMCVVRSRSSIAVYGNCGLLFSCLNDDEDAIPNFIDALARITVPEYSLSSCELFVADEDYYTEWPAHFYLVDLK